MPIATGVFKKVAMKKQTDLGVKAPAGAAGSAKYQRRVTSTLDLNKATFQSNEILASQQRRDMRHGVKSVAGTLSQELSIGTHQQQIESVLRAAAAAGGTKAAATTIACTVAAAGSAQITLTDSGNSFLTSGFKVGDVVDVSGFTTTGVNNNKRWVVLTVVAGTMTLQALNKTDGAVKVAGDNVAIATVGKFVSIPQTAHTRNYWTIEHWHSDIAQSEVFKDCVLTGMNINVQPNGMATIEFPVMGLDMDTGTAEYFTNPAAESTGAILAGLGGAALVDGVSAGVLTSVQVNVNGNFSAPGGVIGRNTDPDIFPGPIDVTGQVTVLFENATMRDKFINETTGSLVVVLVADNGASPAFMSIVMSKVKFGGASKDDGAQGLTLTMPFTALENTEGGAAVANRATTISVQDSAFA